MAKKVYVSPKVSLPSGYTPVEYIESSGTQWIDTGFTPDSNTRIVADIETTTTKPSANKWVFGCRSASATQRFELVYIASASAFRFYFNSAYNAFSGVSLGRLIIDISQSAATINGVSVTPTAGTFDGAGSLFICSCNSSSVSSEAFSQKVRSFKIYDNGTLVRDFVPCKNSGGVAGLYDAVNGVFYTDAAGGTFVAGSDISGGVAREGKKIYVGVSAVARNVKSGYVGVDAVARQFWSSGKPASEFAVGDSVYLLENGVAVEYIVIHQGIPNSSLYGDGCNGMWLWRKDIYTKIAWNASDDTNYDYAQSKVHSYLSSTFLALFDAATQAVIKTASIPQHSGTAGGSALANVSAKVFALTFCEMGGVYPNLANYGYNNGAKLDYFISGSSLAECNTSEAKAKRIAYYNGTATAYWTRFCYQAVMGGVSAGVIGADGGTNGTTFWDTQNQNGVRPALILDSNAMFDPETNILIT